MRCGPLGLQKGKSVAQEEEETIHGLVTMGSQRSANQVIMRIVTEFPHLARPPVSKLEKCSLVGQVRHHPGAIVEVAQECRPLPTLVPARLNTMIVECQPGPALRTRHQSPC